MRKMFLAAVLFLPFVIAAPAFSQGVQLPSAPNTTPPIGRGSTPNAHVGSPSRPRQAHRRPARSRPPATQTVPELRSR